MLSAKWKRALGMVICSLLLAACGPTHYNVKAKASEVSIPTFSVNGVVNVRTHQASRNRVFEDELISVNYQQIAESSVAILEAAMRENSDSSHSGEPKSLEYAITSIDCLTFDACFINFVIKTGDSDIRGFMTEGKRFMLSGSLKEAVENTALVVFSDQAILDYVAR